MGEEIWQVDVGDGWNPPQDVCEEKRCVKGRHVETVF